MKNSRKQIKAQIETMDRILQSQQNEVKEHKDYFAQSKINRYHLATFVLLGSAFFIGWKVERKQLSSKAMEHVVEVGTLAFLNYFKKSIFDLLK